MRRSGDDVDDGFRLLDEAYKREESARVLRKTSQPCYCWRAYAALELSIRFK